jgi:hypothetical protein
MFVKDIKNLEFADIQELVNTTRISENDRIEYKQTLPADGQKTDPWIDGKDKIGDYALKKLTAEIVAFANSHGGTLVIGIEEDGNTPPRPKSVNALPRCEALEQKLMQSIASRVDPKIDGIKTKSVLQNKDEGVIVISVPRSEHAPHRSLSDKEFYRRERDECKKMSSLEIKALAVRRSRQKVEALWTIKFRMHDSNDVNGGVVVLDEGKIYGGDSQYYYFGIYELINDNKISGYVNIRNYLGYQLTAFGTTDSEMSLNINGDLVDENLTGQIYDPKTKRDIPYVMEKKQELL